MTELHGVYITLDRGSEQNKHEMQIIASVTVIT